jgi:exosortase A-associated hydrolase 1
VKPSDARFVTFHCEAATLAGVLHVPLAGGQPTGVLIVVGGPQYRVGSHRQFVLTARALAGAGYPVFRFDYRGMGDSGGAPRTFDSIDQDISAAIDAFMDEVPTLKQVVILGLCDAASAAIIYCGSGDVRIGGLALANPWARTEAGEAKARVRHYYGQRLLQRAFWGKLMSGGFDFRAASLGFAGALRRLFGADSPPGASFIDRMYEGFRSFRGPVLLLMSGKDLTAREFDDLAASSGNWSELLSQPRVRRVDLRVADHTFSGPGALEQANEALALWLDASSVK